MTSTPQEPLDEPLDSASQDDPGRAPVSGSPAGADSDMGYSRGSEGESAEQAGGQTSGVEGTENFDTDPLFGGSGNSGNL
jgi:hypothetical protein